MSDARAAITAPARSTVRSCCSASPSRISESRRTDRLRTLPRVSSRDCGVTTRSSPYRLRASCPMTALVADGSTSACTAGTPARRASARHAYWKPLQVPRKSVPWSRQRSTAASTAESRALRPARRERRAIHSVQGDPPSAVGDAPTRGARDARGEKGRASRRAPGGSDVARRDRRGRRFWSDDSVLSSESTSTTMSSGSRADDSR